MDRNMPSQEIVPFGVVAAPSRGEGLIPSQIVAELDKYIVEKGSIAVNGISLTVTFSKNREFGVSVIPHTFKETTLSTLKTGASVNLETDIIAKHIEKLIAGENGLTLNKLKDLGY